MPKIVNFRADERPFWQNPSLWQERDYPSTVSRPVEDVALQNIYVLARATRGGYRTVLSDLEKEVDAAMLAAKQARSGYSETDYMRQVAVRLHMGFFQVRSILREIEYVKRHWAAQEIIDQRAGTPLVNADQAA